MLSYLRLAAAAAALRSATQWAGLLAGLPHAFSAAMTRRAMGREGQEVGQGLVLDLGRWWGGAGWGVVGEWLGRRRRRRLQAQPPRMREARYIQQISSLLGLEVQSLL